MQLRTSLTLALVAAAAAAVGAASPPKDPAFVREPGRCAMRGTCGRKGMFGGALPCPDNDPAKKSDDAIYLATLASVCGADFPTTTCCDQSQLETLSSSLAQAEPLIATCPGCKNNFVNYYCHFTCSPNQSQFLAVTETQTITSGGETKEAVKTVEVDVGRGFGEGFFASCRDVKFGATNGYAMDLLGGGAKNYLAFLRYMGQERALGSPFQILYPAPSDATALAPTLATFDNATIVPFNDTPLSCSSPELNARCACPDCPAVCATLPPIASPADLAAHRCRVGKMDCFAFSLVMVYTAALLAFVGLVAWKESSGKKRLKWPSWGSSTRAGYDRVPLEDPGTAGDSEDLPSTRSSQTRSGSGTRSTTNSLIGATSTAQAYDGEATGRRPPAGSSGRFTDSPDLSSQRRRADSSLLDPASEDSGASPFYQPRTYPLNTLLTTFFYRLGLRVARSPFLTLAVCFGLCGVANLGWSRFDVERDPVKLWVAKGSPSELAKAEFDSAFGPFYRTEQVFVYNAPFLKHFESDGITEEDPTALAVAQPGAIDAPVLSWHRLQWWAGVEASIRELRSSPNNYTLQDVCFSPQTDPLPPADASACVTQSLMGYLGDSLQGVSESTWAATLDACATTPAACLPGSGQPMNPKLVLGGIPTSDDDAEGEVQASHARAIVVTYVVKNSLDPEVVKKAEEWEATLQQFLEDLAAPTAKARKELGLQVAYSTGLSLEEELNKSTNTDVPIVALSYVVMFLYVSINLGSSGAGLLKSAIRGISLIAHAIVSLFQLIPVPKLVGGRGRARSGSVTLSLTGSTTGMGAYFRRQLLVDSKFLLGLYGIFIVLLSVSTSVALCSAAGIKVTLIIAEVIPFLVLAIGVDNVFILSHELDQQNQRAYSAASRNGPLFVSYDDQDDEDGDGLPPAEERVARALGRMGPSIMLSASCETVAFGLGAMVGMPAVRNFAIYAAVAVVVNALLQVTIFVSAMAIDLKRVESNRIDCVPCFKLPSSTSMDLGATVSEGFIARFIRTVYAPTLLKKPVKYLVLAVFGGLFTLSWIGARHIELGLDQRLALPGSSYLANYFNSLDTYLDVGPPVYFVAKGVNVTSRATQQQLCGRFSTCDELSLANVLEAERKRPNSSFIAEPPAVWIDDFFQWLNPLLEDCCRVRKRDPSIFCTPSDPSGACQPCFEDADPAWSITMDGLPEGPEFLRYLNQWLISPTDESCPLGGKAGYSSALSLDNTSVVESHFRTYHIPLKTQADFINAMASADRVAKDLSDRTGGEVFAYSLFYVFFSQYAGIVATTREVLTLALLAVFLVTSIILGSWRTGACVILTVFMSVVGVMGAMGAWHISLNAISLVNLVISVGIAVEFCAHIARAFMGASAGGLPSQHPAASRDRDERARAALVDVGSSVLSGITLTKLIGISVLALTRSKLLEVYFFRMWLALIISGALHGLVFLPVALSFWGGQGYALSAEDESWIDAAVGSRYDHAGRPFMGDDDEEASSDEDRF
ncbi:hypothetical protein RQP46_000241 [Phenoliferia psychrophenolica]